MPSRYHNHGVSFLYPDNWELEESPTPDWPKEISVQVPGGGFWTLHVYPQPRPPRDLLDEVVRAMRQEYGEVETEFLEESVEGQRALGCDLDFICLDFLVTSQVRCLEIEGRTLLVQTQAESREHAALLPVFRAMTVALARGA